ncbi:MAG: hypothetical protein RMK01_09175 [Thermomicrobium sp.]|nr:hypothetical protein [Thermomicrobium sp.]MDW8060232.1 hypothetical protein [Thermomicrobium sp.]
MAKLRLVRFLASSALGIAAGAAVAAFLSSERCRRLEATLRARWQHARRAANAEAARTEQELWARFRQLVGLPSQDGLPTDFSAPPR